MHIKLNGYYEQEEEIYTISTDLLTLNNLTHATIDEEIFHFCGEIVDSQLSVSHYVNGLLLNNGVAFLKGPKNISENGHPFLYMLGKNELEDGIDVDKKGYHKLNGIWMPANYNRGMDISILDAEVVEYFVEKYKSLLDSFLNTKNENGDLWYEDLKNNGIINPTEINIQLL